MQLRVVYRPPADGQPEVAEITNAATGERLSGVTQVHLEMYADKPPVLQLTLIPYEIDVTADADLVRQAFQRLPDAGASRETW